MGLFSRRKPQAPVPRQRLRSEGLGQQTAPFMYHARRDQRPEASDRHPQEDVPKRRRQRQFTNKYTILGGLIVGLIILVWLLGLSTTPTVQKTSVSSQKLELRTNDEYAKAAQAVFAQSIWNRNKLTIDTDAIQAELLKKFPELAAATVTVPFIGNKPVLHIVPAQPSLLLAASNGTYVIDSRGRAIIMQANLPKNQRLSLPTITDQSNLKVRLNEPALTGTTVTFIRTVLAQLQAKKVGFTTLTLPPSANELDVQIANQPYYVKFNLASNTPREQAGTFLATQQELKKKNITPSKYIDVRLEGRAYYQ